MSLVPQESRPSPWLQWLAFPLLGVLTSLATTAWQGGQRDADLRHAQATLESHGRRIESLESRANGSDVTLEGFRVELRHIREGVDDLRSLLRGVPSVQPTTHRRP